MCIISYIIYGHTLCIAYNLIISLLSPLSSLQLPTHPWIPSDLTVDKTAHYFIQHKLIHVRLPYSYLMCTMMPFKSMDLCMDSILLVSGMLDEIMQNVYFKAYYLVRHRLKHSHLLSCNCFYHRSSRASLT